MFRTDLEFDDDLRFEYFLADRLGMTVARLRQEMGNGELLYWNRYHVMVQQEEELASRRR